MGTFTIEQSTIDEIESILNEFVSAGKTPPVNGIIRPDGYSNVPGLENLANPDKSEHVYFLGKLDGNVIAIAAMARFKDPYGFIKIIHRLHFVDAPYQGKNVGSALMKAKADYCEQNNWNVTFETVHFSYLMMGYADDFLAISGWDPYTIGRFGGKDFIGYRTTWKEYQEIPSVVVNL